MRRLYYVLGCGLALCVLLAAWFYRFQTPADIYTLNGHSLRAAYFVPVDANQTSIRLIVQMGERDNKGTQGIPHYVEHLAWLNAIGANGAVTNRHTNAFTSADATEYMLNVAPEETEAALQMLRKVFAPFSLDESFMRSEREIILREYDARNAENPLGEYIDQINQIGYVNDDLARSVIGSKADIAVFSLQEAKDWHRASHRAENTTLLIASPWPRQVIEGLVARVFAGPNPSFIPAAVGFNMGPMETIERRLTDARFGSGLINLQKTVQITPPLPLADQMAQLSLLYDILDSTLEGSYARPLRFDKPIAQSYDLQLFALSDRVYELSIVAARPDAGVSLDALQKGLLAAIAGADIPAATFERVKERWLARIEAEDRAQMAFDLAHTSITRRVGLVTPSDYLAAARAITLADMNRYTSAFAGQGRMIIDVISPQ